MKDKERVDGMKTVFRLGPKDRQYHVFLKTRKVGADNFEELSALLLGIKDIHSGNDVAKEALRQEYRRRIDLFLPCING